jgi:hypothetical protein
MEEEGLHLGLIHGIETNTNHYLDIMARAIDNVMPTATREIK